MGAVAVFDDDSSLASPFVAGHELDEAWWSGVVTGLRAARDFDSGIFAPMAHQWG